MKTPIQNRRHPSLVATRVTPTERAMVDAAARARGLSITALVREVLLPAVGREVAMHAAALERSDADAASESVPAATAA